MQVLSEKANGAMTKSPGATVWTLDADGLDDADELVTDAPGSVDLGQSAVGPEVRAADAGRHDADDGIAVLDQLGGVDVVESDVTGRVENGGSHGAFSTSDDLT